MKYLLLLCMVLTGTAYAQNLADAVRPLRISAGRMLPVTADGKLIGTSNPDTEGSPYFDTAWNNTNLSLANGDITGG